MRIFPSFSYGDVYGMAGASRRDDEKNFEHFVMREHLDVNKALRAIYVCKGNKASKYERHCLCVSAGNG